MWLKTNRGQTAPGCLGWLPKQPQRSQVESDSEGRKRRTVSASRAPVSVTLVQWCRLEVTARLFHHKSANLAGSCGAQDEQPGQVRLYIVDQIDLSCCQ